MHVFVDLQRAFEPIDRIFIEKLRLYGVGIKWIRDYLSNRFKRTKVGCHISSKIESLLGDLRKAVFFVLFF